MSQDLNASRVSTVSRGPQDRSALDVGPLPHAIPEAPRRIQLSRARGWSKPEGAVVVSRPTKWGNPHDWRSWRDDWPSGLPINKEHSDQISRDEWCKDRAAQAFREDLADGALSLPIAELRGKSLCCWCKLGDPCHADVLLELANADGMGGPHLHHRPPRLDPGHPLNLPRNSYERS